MATVTEPLARLPAITATRRWQARAAGASLAVLTAAGLAIVLGSASGPHGKLVPILHRLTADWVLGPLHALGISMSTNETAWRREYGVMGVAYVAVVLLAPRLRMRWIAGAVVGLTVAFTLSPLLLSTDVFNYVEYAFLGAHGLNPYVHSPGSAPGGPVWVAVHWRHTVDAYGPLFTLASYPLGTIGAVAAVWIFKAVTGVAALVCAWLVWWMARRLGRSPKRALAAFALNPILLVSTLGGGHNDLVMLAVLLGGVALLVASRELSGGALMMMAVGIKATAGLAIPLMVLGSRRRWRAAAGVVAGAVVLAVVASVGFSDHALGMLSVMRHEQADLTSHVSMPMWAARLMGLSTVPASWHPFLTAGCVIALAALTVWVWRGGDAMAAVAFGFLALLVTSQWMLSWYAIWPLGFAALARRPWSLVSVVTVQTLFGIGEVVLVPH